MSDIQGERPVNTSTMTRSFPFWRCLTKSQIQRVDRGFSTEDAWDFDLYLAEVIAGAMRELCLPGNMHGCPAQLVTGDVADAVDQGVEKWKAILGEIATGFEAYSTDACREQSPELERSFDLLRKWFGDMWD